MFLYMGMDTGEAGVHLPRLEGRAEVSGLLTLSHRVFQAIS
jgi:hypothetical protein